MNFIISFLSLISFLFLLLGLFVSFYSLSFDLKISKNKFSTTKSAVDFDWTILDYFLPSPDKVLNLITPSNLSFFKKQRERNIPLKVVITRPRLTISSENYILMVCPKRKVPSLEYPGGHIDSTDFLHFKKKYSTFTDLDPIKLQILAALRAALRQFIQQALLFVPPSIILNSFSFEFKTNRFTGQKELIGFLDVDVYFKDILSLIQNQLDVSSYLYKNSYNELQDTLFFFQNHLNLQIDSFDQVKIHDLNVLVLSTLADGSKIIIPEVKSYNSNLSFPTRSFSKFRPYFLVKESYFENFKNFVLSRSKSSYIRILV